jgi:MOSC domain-containing protein YiiM
MESRATATLEAGRGIVGDRYHAGSGQLSAKLLARGDDDWQITLIESEEISSFLTQEGLDFGPGDFRRNLVTSGLRLNKLVGCRFSIADAVLEGVRLCEPCAYLSGLLTDRLIPTMLGRCGLRARIIIGGRISAGSRIATMD